MSDLLIHGMEMPKDGFITITVTSDGRVVGNSKKENGKFEYLDNEDIAKAVPVPPHGALIDKDAIRKKCERGEYPNVFIDSKELAAEFYAAPTIIPAEEGET